MQRGQLGLFTKRVRKPPPAPEFHLHCMVADVLRRWANPGWCWWHLPSGEKRSAITGARLKRMGAKRGLPDFELLAPREGNPRPFFLELKRRNGKQTEDQAQFAAWCGHNNCSYAIADSFENALFILKEWGVVKTEIST
jgi:hypothetical protein